MTIADSLSKILLCKQELATKYGVTAPTEEQVRQALGKPFDKAMEISFPDCSPEVRKQIGNDFHDLMKEARFQAGFFDDAIETLRELKAAGVQLAIATSKERGELDSALKHHDIEDLFDITCCGAEYKNKPDPYMMTIIQTHFDVSADDCVMIGDTLKDMLFAENAGVESIFVTFGAGKRQDLRGLNKQPIVTVDSWQELHDYIYDYGLIARLSAKL